MKRHLALDIESLDTTPRTVILSVGAVAFDTDASEFAPIDSYHRRFDIAPQIFGGRTVSQSTIDWWRLQSKKAHAEVLAIDHGNIVEFAEWTHLVAPITTWAWGTHFDIAALEDMAQESGVKLGWAYNSVRCARSVFKVREAMGLTVPSHKPEIAHSALSDAMALARNVYEFHRSAGL